MQPEFDLIIANGRIATAADSFSADIGIRDGRIVALGQLSGARETIDASGRLVLPGGIDAHVHLAQDGAPGIVMGDDFETGTRSAAFGGNTTVMPFCVQKRGQSLREALKHYHARAEGACYTDTSFHLIVTDPTEQVLGQDLPALVAEGYSSLKVFMTYADMVLTDYQILGVMQVARETGALVMVHAEGFDAIRFNTEQLEAGGAFGPKFHATSRPEPVEREATHRAATLAELSDVPVMIVHVSGGEVIDEIARARGRGVKVLAETCPQYLVLEEGDLDREGMEGSKYVCSPPPRDRTAQGACWQGLIDGTFDVFSSDHCPYRFDETGKLTPDGKRSFRWIPNGIPGIETRLPILFSEGVKKGRIDINRFVALTATNPARIYGLKNKGTIAIGADADIVIWDPDKTVVIGQDKLHHGTDYTPYEGLEVTGWPETTILRGQVVVRDGELVSGPAGGHVLRPVNGMGQGVKAGR
ncbi:MAG: dihydropyrimidinase [Devosia sp.]